MRSARTRRSRPDGVSAHPSGVRSKRRACTSSSSATTLRPTVVALMPRRRAARASVPPRGRPVRALRPAGRLLQLHRRHPRAASRRPGAPRASDVGEARAPARRSGLRGQGSDRAPRILPSEVLRAAVDGRARLPHRRVRGPRSPPGALPDAVDVALRVARRARRRRPGRSPGLRASAAIGAFCLHWLATPVVDGATKVGTPRPRAPAKRHAYETDRCLDTGHTGC